MLTKDDLRDMRLSVNLKQWQFAKHTSHTRGWVSHVENGTTRITSHVIVEFTRAAAKAKALASPAASKIQIKSVPQIELCVGCGHKLKPLPDTERVYELCQCLQGRARSLPPPDCGDYLNALALDQGVGRAMTDDELSRASIYMSRSRPLPCFLCAAPNTVYDAMGTPHIERDAVRNYRCQKCRVRMHYDIPENAAPFSAYKWSRPANLLPEEITEAAERLRARERARVISRLSFGQTQAGALSQ